ncbi:unnamed protein product, partial [Clonostachys solani]
CDQNWPTCTACQRNSIICSGPSSLVKFVNHGDGRKKSGMSLETQTKAKPAEPNNAVVMIERKPWMRLGEDGASQAVFRLQAPRMPATTAAERVSRRLFTLLEDGHETVAVMKMSYLPHTPQRIAHSACLRDCAAFFCSAWSDYRRREPAENLLAPRLCVKAVKSLQQALNGGKGYTPETLAAMNMLERAVSLFGVGKAPDLELHLRGIRHVLMQNPAPDIRDPFDLGAAFESVCILRSAGVNGLGDNGELKSPWREVLYHAGQEHLNKNQNKYLNEAYMEFHAIFANFSQWLGDVRKIRANPEENRQLAKETIQSVSDGENKIYTVVLPIIENLSRNGAIVEVPDPESRFGWKLDFSSVGLAQQFIEMQGCRMILLRILWDIGVWYGESNLDVYNNYRAVALKLWTTVPYVLTTQPIEAMDLFEKLLSSLEAADDEEMEYLLDQLLIADNYQRRYPRDKTVLKQMALTAARQVTGRI